MFKNLIGLIIVLTVSLMLGCSSDDPVGVDETDPGQQPPEAFALPFNENFDETITEICKDWNFSGCPGGGVPAAGSVPFSLDELVYSSRPASMGAGAKEGQRYGNYHGHVFWGGGFTLSHIVDLSDKSSCTLTFLNKRQIARTISLPSPLGGTDNDSRCILEVRRGNVWVVEKTFSSSVTDWSLETVSLNSYVGRDDVGIRFRIKQHATSESSPSTSWNIDDLTLVAN